MAGGGSGYVYIGASARLRHEGRQSDYLAVSSTGALIGAFLARRRELDIASILTWAGQLTGADVSGRPCPQPGHSQPGITRLHLQAMHDVFVHEDGSPQRLADMQIPYDPVISGVHTRAYKHLPESLRSLTAAPKRTSSYTRLLAKRMMMLPAFFSPQVTQPIVLGRDEVTKRMRVADAVGLSAAIPGVLQYLPAQGDAETDAALAALRAQERVATFVDGGVSVNVPARLAWEGVQAGRIGTRNAFILALDCFAPQRNPKHLWVWPVTQAIQLQLPSQRNYFDWLVSFSPTLPPANLLPSAADFDLAYQWGWNQVDSLVPMLLKALETVSWRP